MKKYSLYKTIQLVIFLLLAAIVVVDFIAVPQLFHSVASEPGTRTISILLWSAMALSFAFLYLDFSFFLNYRKEYREMEKAAGTDPVSGIANRFSCDTMIDKYYGKILREGAGCIMFDLKSIQTIERATGNELIRTFSMILRLSSSELCFVGRNGGIKFMALFEDGGEESVKTFLTRVEERVANYNASSGSAVIEYSYGCAISGVDEVTDIIKLISLANSRIV